MHVLVILRRERRRCAKAPVRVVPAAGVEMWSHKVSGLLEEKGCLVVSREAVGLLGKALNFCQAQMTMPFFTSWYLTEKIIPLPSHMNSMHMPWVNSGSSLDRIHSLLLCLFYYVVRQFLVLDSSYVFSYVSRFLLYNCINALFCFLYN